MKISKKQLITVDSLKLSGVLDKMDDEQFNGYCDSLDSFIKDFPGYQEELKKSFESKDRNDFSQKLLTIMDMLTKICATDLAQSSFNLLSAVRDGNYETAEAQLNDFLTTISTLSIDIQMAQYRAVDENDEAAANAAANAAAAQEQQRTILAVDDVSFLLNTLKATLMNSNYKFFGVTSGNAALRFLQNHTPDLFILDIEMPEMNGYELAKKIRELGQTAPIIFLTGNATSDYVLKAMQAGAADFIVKPVSKGCVLEKIKKYIR